MEISCLSRESKHNTSAVQYVSSYNTYYKSSENLGRRAGKIGGERNVGRRTARNNFSLTSAELCSKRNCPPPFVTRLSQERLDHLNKLQHTDHTDTVNTRADNPRLKASLRTQMAELLSTEHATLKIDTSCLYTQPVGRRIYFRLLCGNT
jgi:hypothetical protein